ncbi:MAG: hypothetical protein K2F87_03665 [Muribaculaceae bacterium]|nr:hypothetical protein [Muribaculaceae bacterium]
MTPHPELQAIKHSFMAYRNGIVADTLRKAGAPYGVIFGLQLPQLGDIARSQIPSADLARELWNDRNVRESRLLAAWLFPVGDLEYDEALGMATDVLTREEADILAFRLLRRLPYAPQLAETLLNASGTLPRYAGEALRRNLTS